MFRKTTMTALLILLSQLSNAADKASKKDIMGVWKLSKFVTVNDTGAETNWCEGAHGTIAYAVKRMTVAINCKSTRAGSGAEKLSGMLFYSGPYSFNKNKQLVTHKVENYSDKSLHKNFQRIVQMDAHDNLRLVGLLGEGKKVIVEWTRAEEFTISQDSLVGSWKLIASENQVRESSKTIPFCSGFHGTIFYTPGGYAAVSINCGKKADSNTTEPADQFGRKYFYSGSYYKDVNQDLIQTPMNASEEAHIGRSFHRKMKIQKNILTLEGTNGSTFLARWKKTSDFSSFE